MPMSRRETAMSEGYVDRWTGVTCRWTMPMASFRELSPWSRGARLREIRRREQAASNKQADNTFFLSPEWIPRKENEEHIRNARDRIGTRAFLPFSSYVNCSRWRCDSVDIGELVRRTVYHRTREIILIMMWNITHNYDPVNSRSHLLAQRHNDA